jgi:hypothetical protein
MNKKMDSDLYLIPFFIHSVHAVFLSPLFIPPSPLGMTVEQMRKEHSIYTGLIYLIKRNKGERKTSLPTSAEMGHPVEALVPKRDVPISARVPKWDIPFWHWCLTLTLTASTVMDSNLYQTRHKG